MALLLYLLLLLLPTLAFCSNNNDTDTLTTFRILCDPHNHLLPNWTGPSACSSHWLGITCSSSLRVTSLSLPSLSLRCPLPSLSPLSHLRLLSLPNNRITSLSSLPTSLRLLYLSNNDLSSPLLPPLPLLARLDLSSNSLLGPVPSFSSSPHLLTLLLNDNFLSGPIPSLLPLSLTRLNLSNNRLSGPVPPSLLSRFGPASFSNNVFVRSNPTTLISPTASTSAENTRVIGNKSRVIIGVAAGNVAFLLILLTLVVVYCYCNDHIGRVQVMERQHEAAESLQSAMTRKRWSNGESEGEEGQSKLVFFGEERKVRRFGLEELLRSSAEMLGKGSLGTVYRAVLEDGSAMAVKRLKDANPCGRKDFHKYMDLIGKIRHPNVVPLKAYYFAKQEKLLIYEYLPNGSLFSLLHGKYC